MGVMVERREAEHAAIEPSVADAVDTVRRRIWIVLLATLLSAGAGYGYGSIVVPEYTATVQVVVDPILTSSTRPPEPVTMTTERTVAGSSEVLELAATRLGGATDLATLDAGSSVDVIDGTEILEISYTDRVPEIAGTNAQALADAYLGFREQRAQDALQAHAAEVEAHIDQVRSSLALNRQKMESLDPGSPEWDAALDRRNALTDQRLALEQQLVQVTSLSTLPGKVIQPAGVPTSPSTPAPLFFGAAGALLGLLFGLGVAYTWPTSHRRRGHGRHR